MTAYETITICLEILTLLVAFGGFIITTVAFLDKRTRKKKK